MNRKLQLTAWVFLLTSFSLIFACRTTYYSAWESLGKEKRHLLRDHVEKAREDQEEASEQFESVLEKIKKMYGFDGGELEDFYDDLKSDYEECGELADSIRGRIGDVEQVAADLFEEWENELDEIGNAKMRANSRNSLNNTKKRYARLKKSMVRAESSMNPVLANLKDYVLYLKHNLNARAIGSLKQEVDDIEREVGTLIANMNKSIKEAEEFLKIIEWE